MKQFSGYDDAKKEAQMKPSEKLPAGAYVCKVMAVRYEQGKDGKSDVIVLQIDVAEGEHKDFFKKQYEENTAEDKKWKGRVNIYVPADDGSDKDKWTKKSFAGWMDSFEKSNMAYAWDWDENKLKGKTVGIVFGTTGAVIEGREVVYTEPRFGVPAEDVRSGKAPAAKFKARDGYTGKGTTAAPQSADKSPSDIVNDGFMTVADDNTDIPF